MGKKRVAWSSTHQEFLISDAYYFSRLARGALEEGLLIEEVDDFAELFSYDTVVFNYPESPFSHREIEAIKEGVIGRGKRVIFAAHFQNKDDVARICTEVSRHFGILVLNDQVTDGTNHLEGDPYRLVTSQVLAYNRGVCKVVFPYSAPLEVLDGGTLPILRGMETSRTSKGLPSPVLAAERTFPSGGAFVLCGSCIFWDNYSITFGDNFRFALNLLKGLR
ncbi:hypothetical protein [Desulfovirgula thermocuniculi]|uniref:hypothetical protein n=1 Tax=Desulfovirgula thermocuniculi TaxID=348842 RepID=UPI000426E0BA|nr:hypothetical protein [Desulfovirgula thermocuniculi]